MKGTYKSYLFEKNGLKLNQSPLYSIGQHQARLDLPHRAYPFILLELSRLYLSMG